MLLLAANHRWLGYHYSWYVCDLDWMYPVRDTITHALALGIAVAGGIMCSGCLTIHLFDPFLWTHYIRNTVTEMFQIWTQQRSKIKPAVPSYPSLCCEHFGILMHLLQIFSIKCIRSSFKLTFSKKYAVFCIFLYSVYVNYKIWSVSAPPSTFEAL